MPKYTLEYLAASFLCFLLLIQIACQVEKGESATNPVSPSPTTTPPQSDSDTSGSQNRRDRIANVVSSVPPISIRRVSRKGGKPPLQIYSFDIEFRKERDDYKWILTRAYSDSPLSDSDVFANREDFVPRIEGHEYQVAGHKGKVVLIIFLGKETFRAIRAPKEGVIRFAPYSLSSDSAISEFEVWEVQSLLVNGKTPLEEWLPYSTESDATIYPVNDQSYDGRTLLFETNPNANNSGTYQPKEEIKFIVAKDVRKWNVPFKLNVDKYPYGN